MMNIEKYRFVTDRISEEIFITSLTMIIMKELLVHENITFCKGN